jgi:hypothetical protein
MSFKYLVDPLDFVWKILRYLVERDPLLLTCSCRKFIDSETGNVKVARYIPKGQSNRPAVVANVLEGIETACSRARSASTAAITVRQCTSLQGIANEDSKVEKTWLRRTVVAVQRYEPRLQYFVSKAVILCLSIYLYIKQV